MPAATKTREFDERIQQAYDVVRPDGGKGIPVILYHYMRFFGQRADQVYQLQYLLENLTKSKIPGKSYHAVVLDIEEKGDSSTNIQEKTEEVYAALLARFPGIPVIFYTSNNYLETVSPALRDWLGQKDNSKHLWMAQWPWSRRTIGWDALPQYIPGDTVKVLTPGYAAWKFWQWAGDVSGFEGCSNSIDLNFYNGTTAQLYSWLNFQQDTTPPEPPPVDPPVDPPPVDLSAVIDNQMEILGRLDSIQDKLNRRLPD